jgi:hypothetical protein
MSEFDNHIITKVNKIKQEIKKLSIGYNPYKDYEMYHTIEGLKAEINFLLLLTDKPTGIKPVLYFNS